MIFDTDDDTTKRIPQLKALGVATVIRYLSRSYTWKTVTPNEAKALAQAGIKLGLVFETTGKPSGLNTGSLDGTAAIRFAKEVGAPTGTVIWYAVDYDPSPNDMPGIEAAFTGFSGVVRQAGYRVGIYGSGFCNAALLAKGLVDKRWLTQSLGFRGTRDAIRTHQYDLLQLLPKHVAGLDTDPDVPLIPNGDIGDFLAFAPAPAQPGEA